VIQPVRFSIKCLTLLPFYLMSGNAVEECDCQRGQAHAAPCGYNSSVQELCNSTMQIMVQTNRRVLLDIEDPDHQGVSHTYL
jgi:hypothetical protein